MWRPPAPSQRLHNIPYPESLERVASTRLKNLQEIPPGPFRINGCHPKVLSHNRLTLYPEHQAVFHRQTGEKEVANEFIRIASRLLLLSMFPLVGSICIDFYLISRVILNNVFLAVLLTLGIFSLFLAMWIGLPRSETLRRLLGGK